MYLLVRYIYRSDAWQGAGERTMTPSSQPVGSNATVLWSWAKNRFIMAIR